MTDSDQAYHDNVGGFVRPERCITAQLQTAKARGAELRLNEKVVSFDQVDGSVTVKTDKGTYRAAELIVSAGAWLPGILKPALAGPFMVTRQVLYWFRARSEGEHAQFAPERFPVYIWQVPAPQSIYGFPATGGLEEGVKLATEQDHVTTTPEAVARTVGPDEMREMYDTYVGPYFPGRRPSASGTRSVFTPRSTAPASSSIGTPTLNRVIVASPCSGHGFKHSAGIGELLAQMVLGEDSRTSPGSASAEGRQDRRDAGLRRCRACVYRDVVAPEGVHHVGEAARAAQHAIAAVALARLEHLDGAGDADREHVQSGERLQAASCIASSCST